jgi:hypothetical protein
MFWRSRLPAVADGPAVFPARSSFAQPALKLDATAKKEEAGHCCNRGTAENFPPREASIDERYGNLVDSAQCHSHDIKNGEHKDSSSHQISFWFSHSSYLELHR